MGMAVSNDPKIRPTRSRVRASTPLTPMPTEAAKLSRPRESATSSKATMAGLDHFPAAEGATSAQHTCTLNSPLAGSGSP